MEAEQARSSTVRLTDAPVSARMCPDEAQPQPEQNCPGAEVTTDARLYFHAGGAMVRVGSGAPTTLHADATAGAPIMMSTTQRQKWPTR